MNSVPFTDYIKLRVYSNYLPTTDNNQTEKWRATTTMQRNNTVPTEQNELQNKKKN